jgi:hypothetical protein
MKMKNIFALLITFLLIVPNSSFSQNKTRSENGLYLGISFDKSYYSIKKFNGQTFILAPDQHVIWPLPNLSPGNGIGLTLGKKKSDGVWLINYSRSSGYATWHGPDFYDLKWSQIKSKVIFNAINFDYKYFLFEKKFIQLYIQPGVNFSFLKVEKGAATYVEIRGDIFADNYDTKYSFWGFNCNSGIVLIASKNIMIDTGFLIKYLFLDSDDIKGINGFVYGYRIELAYIF